MYPPIQKKSPLTFNDMLRIQNDALSIPRPRATRVFYIDIGNMPMIKADTYFGQVVATYKATIDNVHYENIFIAVREQGSKVEVFPYPFNPAVGGVPIQPKPSFSILRILRRMMFKPKKRP